MAKVTGRGQKIGQTNGYIIYKDLKHPGKYSVWSKSNQCIADNLSLNGAHDYCNNNGTLSMK